MDLELVFVQQAHRAVGSQGHVEVEIGQVDCALLPAWGSVDVGVYKVCLPSDRIEECSPPSIVWDQNDKSAFVD